MVIRIKKTSHFTFKCLLFLLIALLFVRYSFNINIPRIVLTSILIAISLVGNQNEILAVLLCCIPLHEAIDFYITLIICTVIMVVKYNRNMTIRAPSIICGIFMLFWELLHCFLFDISAISLVISITPILFLIVLLNVDISKIDYSFIVRTLSIISSVICVVLLLNCVIQADFNFVRAVSSLRRIGIISGDSVLLGGRINPNSLGIINLLVVTGLLQLRFLDRQKKTDYIMSIVLITFGILTSSRTFLVCLIIMISLLIVGQNGNLRKKIRFLLVLLALGVIVWYLLNWFFPSVLEYYIGRFQMDNITDITTGRNILMIQYHDYIVNNVGILLFGIGVTDLPHKAINIYNISNNIPHNSIQEIILAWGVPGFVMIFVLIFVIFAESKRYHKKKTILNFIPLIIVLVKSMAGQLLTSGYSILALGFAYLSLCQNLNSTN